LQEHLKVEKVYFPGLLEGKEKETAESQMKKPGGMLSVELKPEYNIYDFLNNLKLFPLAESLGGVESLIDHPASMTHGSIPKEEREKIGLSDNLLRISTGIENSEDLLQDLKNGLNKI
jgi:cystathionine gamma-lyase/cystathionine beta-lyase